ncbi:hypothetical protein PENTCL1PPCAC_17583 [Pristionchus entomophagus]|uniref:Lipid-binding serum glycoprotein C-terminal domain-containing protein n=1 Tax=Pristionchus entomophagus TaxID=358040 RepID=A0AAV5TME7_9BILA|nr:hypothetical protein PENTCL1PPCAC_17583 [Pristionchus entomophagus]
MTTPLATSFSPSTPHSCTPSFLKLNISGSLEIPTEVAEKDTVVGSNILMGCLSTSFQWTVGEVAVTGDSPYYLSVYLANGQVSHVCLNMDNKRDCGYIKYPLPSSSSPSTLPSSSDVTPTIDPNLQKIHDEVVNLVTNRCDSSNGTNLIESVAKLKDPQAFLETLTAVLTGALDLSNGGLSTDQVIDLMKKYINTENDDVAKAMAILMKQLSNVSITDTATLNSILSTLDAALKGSLSYSLVGDGKSLANVFGVIFGTIKGPKVNLMTAKCTAQVQGNVIYMKGDIRSAKYQDTTIPITILNDVRMMSISELQAIGFSANFPMSPFENYTIAGRRQMIKVIGKTQMMVGSGAEEPESGLCLWNCTFDHLGAQSQSLMNMTFTSWVKISSATLILPQSSSTLSSLRIGQLVPSASLKITAEFAKGSNVMTYLGGNIQLMSMNAEYVSFSITGGQFNPAPTWDVTKIIVDPVRIEGVSTDMLLSMDSQSGKGEATMDLTPANGYTMMMITGLMDVPPLSITENPTNSIHKAFFRPLVSSMSKADFENNFVSGTS